MRYSVAFGAGLLGIATASFAWSQTFVIDAHILSSGTAAHSSSVCFGLDAVIGEAIAGYSQSPVFAVNAGFLALVATPTDTIFASGFEDCSP